MSTVSITQTNGQPLPRVADDHPFKVTVTTDTAGSANPPAKIDVTISAGGDTETLTLRWVGNTSGNARYESNALTVEGGGESSYTDTFMGFGYSSGSDMGGMNLGDGTELTVSYDGAGASTTVHESWHMANIATLDEFLTGASRFWHALGANLGGVEEEGAAELRAAASQKISLIAQARRYLDNENLLPGQRVRATRLFVRYIRSNSVSDTEGLQDTIDGTMEAARWDAHDVIISGFADLALGMYHMFTNATGSAQVWTLFSGQDIMGKKVGWGERIMAAVDIASNTVLQGAGTVRNLDSIKKTHGTKTTTRAQVTKVQRGVDPEEVWAGTPVTGQDFGMRTPAVRHARRVAEKHGVVLEVRPANLDSMPWQAQGHPPKPMAIKQKTINALDVELGANPNNIGLVGYFEPKLPPNASPAVVKRYKQRLNEFQETGPKIKKMEQEGLIRVEDGVVVDTGLCGGTNKGITGDYDPWAMRKKDGTPLTAEEGAAVLEDLKNGPFQAQHGCHTWWEPKTDFELQVDAKIRNSHKVDGEALLEIGGLADGPLRAKFANVENTKTVSKTGTKVKSTTTKVDGGRLPVAETLAGVRAATGGAKMETPDPDDDGEPISTPRPPWFDWLKWIIPALGVLILVILVVTLSGGGDDQTENAVQNPVAQEQPATDDADTGQQEQDLVAIPDQGQTTDEEPDSAETDENTQNAVPGADVDEGEGENTAGGNDNEGVDPDEEAAEQETKLGLLIAQLEDLQGRAVGVATFLVGLGVPETQAVAFVGGAFNDPIRDLIYSISRILVARDDPSVDIATAWAIDTILGTGAHTLLYNNSVYECGAEDPVRVVCPDNVEDVPEGSVLVVAAEMDGTLGMAANPTDQFVYGFVADTDGDPANDWIPQGDFDWDYFGGTDTWYQVFIDGSGATMTRTDATTFEQLPTAARAIIIDKTILFVVPTEELGGDLSTVSWRVTAFVHDGTFQPEVSAGDVLGANPTEPLYPIGDNVVEVTVESVEQGQADLEEFLEELAAEE